MVVVEHLCQSEVLLIFAAHTEDRRLLPMRQSGAHFAQNKYWRLLRSANTVANFSKSEMLCQPGRACPFSRRVTSFAPTRIVAIRDHRKKLLVVRYLLDSSCSAYSYSPASSISCSCKDTVIPVLDADYKSALKLEPRVAHSIRKNLLGGLPFRFSKGWAALRSLCSGRPSGLP